MVDPMRFAAFDVDGNRIAASQDPQEVQRAAEAYTEKHREPVHLYQHVLTVQVSEDGT